MREICGSSAPFSTLHFALHLCYTSTMGSKAETSTYCRSCLYDLRGIGQKSRCPECGRAFDLADPKTFTTRPRRKLWWRRLRWVVYPTVLVVLAVGGAFGWLWWGWHREQVVVAWVKEHQGRVRTESIAPLWLQKRFGHRAYLLQRMTSADARINPGENPQYCPLFEAKRLTAVFLGGPGVDGRWVEAISKQGRLGSVWLDAPGIASGEIRHLGRLKHLWALHLTRCRLVEADWDWMAELPHLRELTLVIMEEWGPGMKRIGELPNLDYLALGRASLDDLDVEHLGRMKNLQSLNLWDTTISIAGLKRLRDALPNTKIDWTGTYAAPATMPTTAPAK